jgi:exonuclease III
MNCGVMYLNIRGLKSKIDSLLEKVEEVEPAIICITETHLLKTEKVEIDGYKIYRNDRDNLGGGILIGVKEQLKNICTIVEKRSEDGEALWIAIDNTKVKIRLGVIYAPQESRTSKDDLKKMYEKISEQILKAKEKQQTVLVIGDFNCKIGDAIKGNKQEVTKGGKLLLQMAKTNKLESIRKVQRIVDKK